MTSPQQSGRSSSLSSTRASTVKTLSSLSVTLTTISQCLKTSSFSATAMDRSVRNRLRLRARQAQAWSMMRALPKPQTTSPIMMPQKMTLWRSQSSPCSMQLSCLKMIEQSTSFIKHMTLMRMETFQEQNLKSSTVPMFISRTKSTSTVKMTKSSTLTYASVWLLKPVRLSWLVKILSSLTQYPNAIAFL